MKCPICETKTKVSDKREKNRLWRRRECTECDYRFTTYELTAEEILELFEEDMSVAELQKITDVLKKEMPGLSRYKEVIV